MKDLLVKKKVSKKINYDAVQMLGEEQDPDELPPELEAMLEPRGKAAQAR